jgi:thiol-disulfide isomerase/thioredoxin
MRLCLLLPLLLLPACDAERAPRSPQEIQTAGPGSGKSTPESSAPVAGKVDRSRTGTPAPATAFEDPDGASTSLAEFRGKPVLLNLWATWCAPCVKELPTLDALQVREGDRLQVLPVSQDMEGRAKVDAFLAKNRYRALEGWIDPEMALMADLGVTTLPTTILYDAAGREVWRVAGDKNWSGAEAAALLKEAG